MTPVSILGDPKGWSVGSGETAAFSRTGERVPGMQIKLGKAVKGALKTFPFRPNSPTNISNTYLTSWH